MAQHGMRHEIDGLQLGMANTKIPPAWSIETDKQYPLRVWRSDLEIWAASTDLREEQKAPAAVMRITGAARELLREIQIALLQQGQLIPDPANQGQQIQISGLAVLVRTLERRYGSSEEEIVIHTISDLMRFVRKQGETADSMMARFDVALWRANNIGGVDFGPQLRALASVESFADSYQSVGSLAHRHSGQTACN